MNKGTKMGTFPNYLIDYDISQWLSENSQRVVSNYNTSYQPETYFHEESKQITSTLDAYIPVPLTIEQQLLSKMDVIVRTSEEIDGNHQYCDITIKYDPTIS